MVWSSLCECDGEESEEVVVGRLNGDVSFDEGLPFADEGAEFVRGEVEAVEVCKAVLALDFVNSQLDFSEGMVFIVLEVGKGDFENTALQSIVGVL